LSLPVPSKTQASYVIGLGLMEAMQTVMPDLSAAQYQRMVERYRYHYINRGDDTTLFDGVRPMLEDLQGQGYFLAVATGKSRVGLNRALAQSGLTSLFHATRCADETFSKPHPAMLLELCRELGQDKARTVMIGDTTHDLLMANNAGAAAVAVEYGAHPVNLLEECKPRYSAASVTQLHNWLNGQA
jgi:phosphoglycolate phosphatase